jgi:hypothetical protein
VSWEKNEQEEELTRQFGRLLADLSMDDDVVAWIIQALKGSHEDEKRFRNQTTNELLKQREKNQKRLDALYSTSPTELLRRCVMNV